MNSRDLFELASMDALGLLDEAERADFEQAFRAAPPELQAQIRSEQLRYAELEEWLPDVQPPAGLRARVIAAVREAFTSIPTEPIARIRAGSTWLSTAAFWRAACIGFATATVVLAGFVYTVADQNKRITYDALYSAFAGEAKSLGGTALVDVLTSPSMRRVSLQNAGEAASGKSKATLLLDPDSRIAHLVCKGLPIANGEYTLVIGSANGANPRIERFVANSDVAGMRIEHVSVDQLGRVELRAPKGPTGKSELLMISFEQ